MKSLLRQIFVLIALTASVEYAVPLEEQFVLPPEESKPWCYWYWLNGHISEEGITGDLEAMAKVGIREALIGHVSALKEGDGDVTLLSEAWWDLLVHAVREGKRLGVDIGMFNAPGWSQSGGPWIAPEDAMQYLVSSETRAEGPARISQTLPAPAEPFYDVAVIAYPAPQEDGDRIQNHSPAITVTAQHPKFAALIPAGGGKLIEPKDAGAGPEEAPAKPEKRQPISGTVDWVLDAPFTARSLVLELASTPYAIRGKLQAAGPDGTFRAVKAFNATRNRGLDPKGDSTAFMPLAPVALSFPATASTAFRLILDDAQGLGKVQLSASARVEDYIEKQLGRLWPTPLPNWDSYMWPRSEAPQDAAGAVAPESVQVITKHMASDGTLTWDVPEGGWIVQRLGMTPSGIMNRPTATEASGLECDKMSRDVAARHFDAHFGQLIDRVPEDARSAIKHIVIDSYEVGGQTWTPGFEVIFQERLGYDPIPWLPTLSGRVVGTPDQSDRFLWDLRRLVADLISERYVGGLRETANAHGVKLWLENYGHWGYPGEFLQYGGQADHVSGEFWSTGALGSIECRDASSAAHTYGQPVVSAEAFTSSLDLKNHPFWFKRRGDWAYTEGINHFVLHVCAHQPEDRDPPGLNPWFGTAFHRNNPWFLRMRPWVTYLQRCHYMLQQGTHVADLAYFIGEDAPKMGGIRTPELPAGYNFDYVNAEVIRTRMAAKDGYWSLPDGMRYRLLVLPPTDTMRPELLVQIRDLVKAGAAILGAPPERSPSLQGFPACDNKVRELAAELWGNCDGVSVKQRRFGQGMVFNGVDSQHALDALDVTPELSGDLSDLLWTHRAGGDTDLFFISNQSEKPVERQLSFRVSAKAPELWDPASGQTVKTAWFEQRDGRSGLTLCLDGAESVFVVFRDPAPKRLVASVTRNGKDATPANINITLQDDASLEARVSDRAGYEATLSDGSKISFRDAGLPHPHRFDAPWTVAFPSGTETFARLIPWSKADAPSARKFVGTATYKTTFTIPEDDLNPKWRLTLDLGALGIMATVRVNGEEAGHLWKPPFEMDVTGLVSAGDNALEVDITNTPDNSKGSGLLGPVRLRFSACVPL